MLCLVACGVQAEPATRQTEAVYEDGVRRLNAQDFAGAALQFKNVLQQDQNHLPARISLGLANLRNGDARGAAKELRIALALGAAPEQVIPALGNALLAQRKYAEILEAIKSADPAEDGGFEVVLLRARAHFELGQLDEADTGYRRAAELSPRRAEPLTGLAAVALAQSRAVEALQHVDRALALAPQDAEAWFRKGEILRAIGRQTEALDSYTQGITANPEAKRLRLARASLLLERDALPAAEADVARVLDANANDLSALFLRWQIRTQAGDPAAKDLLAEVSARLSALKDSAIRTEPLLLRMAAMVAYARRELVRAEDYLARYGELRPNDRAMRSLRGRVQLLLGDAKSAIESLYPLLQQNPDDFQTLLALGQAFLATARYAEAEDALSRAATLVPDHGGVTAQLALSRVGLGRASEALSGLEAAGFRDGARDASPALLLTLLQFRSGDIEGALRTVERVVQAAPGNVRATNLQGIVLAALGRLEEAKAAFDTACHLAPEYVPPAFNLARIELAAGETQRAVKRLENIVARNPRADAALVALADIAVSSGDREGALKWLDKAAAAAPDAINTQVQLVEMQLAMGQPVLAHAAARRLFERNPDNAQANETLARVLRGSGKHEDARRFFRAAARFASYDGARLMRIAREQTELGDYDEARKTLRKAVDTSHRREAQKALVRLAIRGGDTRRTAQYLAEFFPGPDAAPTAELLRGEQSLRAGDLAAAERHFEASLLVAPGVEAIAGLADTLIAKGDYAGAIQRLEGWLRKFPGDRAVMRQLALTYLPIGELTKSRLVLEELQRAGEQDAVLLSSLARIYQLQKDSRARVVAEQALQRAPDWAVALDTLGWILVTEGEIERGLELLREALAREGNPLTRYHLAQTLHELGRTAEARTELKHIIAAGRPAPLVKSATAMLDALP